MRVFPLFQVILYTGSFVDKAKYTPFIDSFRAQTGYNVTIARSSLVCTGKYSNLLNSWFHPNETFVLIGHSFGGYRACRDALVFPTQVKGLILINSHLNSQGKMPYLRLDPTLFSSPILTVLAENDTRLPLRRALYDLYTKLDDRLYRHFYLVNKGHDHFSGIANENQMQQDTLIRELQLFLRGIEFQNFSELQNRTQPLESRFSVSWSSVLPSSLIHSEPMGVVDALMKLVLPRHVWDLWHWGMFLNSKPDTYINHAYIDRSHIYIKMKSLDERPLQDAIRKWYGSGNVVVRKCTLASVHPSVLLWLGSYLRPYKDDDQFVVPLLLFPINSTVTYVKLPAPTTIFDYVEDIPMIDYVLESLND